MKTTLLTTLALALLLPVTAAAKEISQLQVCGATDCSSTSDRALLARIGEGSNGSGHGAAPALQPFYRLTYTVSAGRRTFAFTTFYVPGAGATRGTDEAGNAVWLPASAEFVAAMRMLTRHVDPLPAPRLSGVTIEGRSVADPGSYARLLTITGPDAGLVQTNDWQTVLLHSQVPSPWTSGGIPMLFSPRTGVLARDGRYLRLPGKVASAIRGGDGIPSSDGRGVPAWGYGLIAAGLAAELALAAVIFLRRPKTGPRSLPEAA